MDARRDEAPARTSTSAERALWPGETRIGALSRAECSERLASRNVGRIAITADDLPAIVPVNYAMSGDTIVFRTTSGGMLARACDDAVVAFEVDELATDGSWGWSILAVGVAQPLDGSRAVRATELGLVSAMGVGRDLFVGITVGQLSGREIGLAVDT